MKYEIANPDFVGYPEEQDEQDAHVDKYYMNVVEKNWWRFIDSDTAWIEREEKR